MRSPIKRTDGRARRRKVWSTRLPYKNDVLARTLRQVIDRGD
jgi:hypothetical protein